MTEWLVRPWIAGLVLLAVYAALSLLMNPGGYLGTDTGAKVYTLEVMDRADTARPDVGYWAEDFDPDGSVHPLYQTAAQDDGGWVAVTTLPMLEAARPLYGLGGYRATLLLPMLGAVGAAFAARSIARHLGSDQEAWQVFWVVGLASPALIYALDFWEHSVGMALMLGAVAMLLDVLDGGAWWRAVLAGAFLGGAAVLRNETFVYAAVAVGISCMTLLLRDRRVVASARTGALAVAGFAVPWFANMALEGAVSGQSRAGRTSGTATRVGDDTGDRIREALQTFFGLNAGTFEQSVLLGVVVVGVLLAAFRGESRGDRRFTMACLAGAALAYLAGAAGGLGFVSGLLLAFPIAIAGFVQAPRTSQTRVVAAIAIVALPLVWAFQYVGGGAPQWGGRYTLTSGILLGIVGLVGLGRRFPDTARGLVALSVFVTALGVGWLGVRTHGVDSFFDDVVADAEPVVISRNAFLVREGGDAVVGRRWLSVRNEDTFQEAIAVARSAGESRFSVLEWGSDAPPPDVLPDDVSEVDRWLLSFVDVPVGLVTYEFSGAET